ncbi:MAG TPA: DUF4231 domain-containing protein [Ktedonobacteraceae bacterium]|jgi:hypothetical protein
MLSSCYQHESSKLKYRFIDGAIDRKQYFSLLETLKQEELAPLVSSYQAHGVEEEIEAFEVNQLDEAEQRRRTQEKEVEAFRLLIEVEHTKQLEEQRKMKELVSKQLPKTLEQEIREAREDFYREESGRTLKLYQEDYRKYRAKHDKLQITVIFCSALSTGFAGTAIFSEATSFSFALKFLAAMLSLTVTIASGSIAYFKYKDRSHDFQKTADAIEGERRAFKLGLGPYRGKPLDEALSLFAENTHMTIEDHKKRQQLLDQPPGAKPEQER